MVPGAQNAASAGMFFDYGVQMVGMGVARPSVWTRWFTGAGRLVG